MKVSGGSKVTVKMEEIERSEVICHTELVDDQILFHRWWWYRWGICGLAQSGHRELL